MGPPPRRGKPSRLLLPPTPRARNSATEGTDLPAPAAGRAAARGTWAASLDGPRWTEGVPAAMLPCSSRAGCGG
jgi:hypothetical protein